MMPLNPISEVRPTPAGRWFESKYDDGGYSGGDTDRPALQRLLGDVRSGKIDVIVVYKVDRLTRSLADFAKLVELFDQHSVSFVSVTQQFNTTTSMGRARRQLLKGMQCLPLRAPIAARPDRHATCKGWSGSTGSKDT